MSSRSNAKPNPARADVWGLVLSRRDSRRLPGKAARMLLGKPMIQYTFEAAMYAASLSRTWVFSDDPFVLSMGARFGMDLPAFERPADVSGAQSTSEDTIRYFLRQFDPAELPDWLVLLQPTSPLRTTEDIDQAVDHWLANHHEADALVSVTRPLKPLDWTCRMDADGRLTPLVSAAQASASSIVLPNGALYIFSPHRLLAGDNPLAGAMLGYEMPWQRSVDIDTAEELAWAEILLSQTHHRQGGEWLTGSDAVPLRAARL